MLDHSIGSQSETSEALHQELANLRQKVALLEQTLAEYKDQVHQQAVELEATNTALQVEIIKRQLAEEQQQRFVALVENSRELVAMYNLDGQLIFLNQAGCQLVGVTDPDAALYMPIAALHSAASITELKDNVWPTLVETGAWEGELVLQHLQTQDAIDVQVTTFAVKQPECEEPICFAAVMRDITERKQAEAQLREQVQREAFLNRLTNQIRNSLDINTILEAVVQQIRVLLQVDRCSFTWYRADAVQPYWDMVKEAKSPELPSLIGRYTTQTVGITLEDLIQVGIIRVNDTRLVDQIDLQQFCQRMGVLSWLVIPLQTDSGAIGVLTCSQVQGIRCWSDREVELLQAVIDQVAIAVSQAELYAETEAKAQALSVALQELQHTQARLIHGEKMSSLGQLVAGVAHEINNPVNFIHGNLTYATEYTHNLLKLVEQYQRHYTDPPEALQDLMEDIELPFLLEDLPKLLASMQVGTERIHQIVLSLRNFSRLDETSMKPVDIHSGIDSTLMILQNRLKARTDRPPIQIVKDYGRLPFVECYAGQLNQVFMNILANAIDALEEQMDQQEAEGTVTATPRIKIQTQPLDDDWVEIRIKDNGPGIATAVLTKLFDPFFTTKPLGKGTGLGMSISYQIVVEKHNGRLECTSNLGQGAEFVIQIPVQQMIPQSLP